MQLKLKKPLENRIYNDKFRELLAQADIVARTSDIDHQVEFPPELIADIRDSHAASDRHHALDNAFMVVAQKYVGYRCGISDEKDVYEAAEKVVPRLDPEKAQKVVNGLLGKLDRMIEKQVREQTSGVAI